MKIMKKTLAIFICVPLILLACVSCGNNNAEIDYSKFSIPYDTIPHYRTPNNEEEFNLYLDVFISAAEYNADDEHDYIWVKIYVKSDETENDETDGSDKEYWGIDHSGVQVRLKMKFDDIDREAIKELAMDEKTEKIVFEHSVVS